MKILLVSESYWPNADGGALFERRLVQGLIGRGHQVQVWAPGRKFRSYEQHDGKSLIHRERAVTFFFNPKYKASFVPATHTRQVFNSAKADIVHIHNPFMLGRTSMRYARRHDVPVVATNHLMPENFLLNLKGIKFLYGRLHTFYWHWLVRFHNKATFVTTPTPTALSFLKKYGLKTPAEAVTNGVDTDIFKPRTKSVKTLQKYKIPSDKPIVLYVGRVDGEKRLDILLKSMPHVLKNTTAHLVICGSGIAMDRLKNLAQKLNIQSSVTFTGYIDEADKPLIYNSANLFAISSPAELQSIVTLEAMASGLPVVSVDVAALHELVHNNANGYLFTENNSGMMAEKITEILKSPDRADKFGKASREIVVKNHSNTAMLNKYENIFQKVVAK
ncbi:glycosyltransferase [Candidatus Saccharibacteria bacterium]|nr:glycosyltransferase [Candidatus Saccharibacteria bacterium]